MITRTVPLIHSPEQTSTSLSTERKDCIDEFGGWDFEVYSVSKATKVMSERVKQCSYLLDTTGWEPGLYAIRAIINGEVLSETIMIK